MTKIILMVLQKVGNVNRGKRKFAVGKK